MGAEDEQQPELPGQIPEKDQADTLKAEGGEEGSAEPVSPTAVAEIEEQQQVDEPTREAPAKDEGPPKASEDGQVYKFDKIKTVMKVHCKGMSLDYWVYDTVLKTNDAAYRDGYEASAAGTTITIATARRYSEFEWLRQALIERYPGMIVPNLPGLKMEGMWDKVKALLMPEKDEGEPPIVSFRKRGLTLFLEWIEQDAFIRSSALVRGFILTGPHGFEDFKSQWKEKRKKEPSLFDSNVDSVKFNLLKLNTKVELPKELQDLQALADTMAKEMTTLKDAVEDLWELQHSTKSMHLPYPHLKKDPVTAALIETGLSMNKALVAKHNTDVAYAKCLVWLSFYAGLNKAVLQALEAIKTQTSLVEAARSKNHPNLDRLEAALAASNKSFSDGVAHWHSFRRMLCKRFPKKFTWLICHLDPTNFAWHEHFDHVLTDLDAAYNLSLEEAAERAAAIQTKERDSQSVRVKLSPRDYLTYVEEGEEDH